MKERDDELISATKLAKEMCGYSHAGQISRMSKRLGIKPIRGSKAGQSKWACVTFYNREDANRITAYSHLFDRSTEDVVLVIEGVGHFLCHRCKQPVKHDAGCGPYKTLCDSCYQFSRQVLGDKFISENDNSVSSRTRNMNGVSMLQSVVWQGHNHYPNSFLIAVMSVGGKPYFRAFPMQKAPAAPWIRILSMQKRSPDERYIAKLYPSCPRMYAFMENALNKAQFVEELV